MIRIQLFSVKPLTELNLTQRTINCLRRAGITTVGELMLKTEYDLNCLRNFGIKSLAEVKRALAGLGVTLAPAADDTN